MILPPSSSVYTSKEEANKFKSVKYPIKAIQLAKKLDSTLQAKFEKNPELLKQLLSKLSEYGSYRQIRGDGNCFFRAVAFFYLCSLKDIHYQICFPLIKSIELTTCRRDSIPKEFKPYYKEHFLKQQLEANWQPTLKGIAREVGENPFHIFARAFAENPYLDFIVILYFRALCFRAFHLYKEELKNFLSGDEEANILTYQQETEGLSLQIMSTFLGIQVHVYEVRAKQVKLYIDEGDKINHPATLETEKSKVQQISGSKLDRRVNSAGKAEKKG